VPTQSNPPPRHRSLSAQRESGQTPRGGPGSDRACVRGCAKASRSVLHPTPPPLACSANNTPPRSHLAPPPACLPAVIGAARSPQPIKRDWDALTQMASLSLSLPARTPLLRLLCRPRPRRAILPSAAPPPRPTSRGALFLGAGGTCSALSARFSTDSCRRLVSPAVASDPTRIHLKCDLRPRGMFPAILPKP
jgi:hypothetical protein